MIMVFRKIFGPHICGDALDIQSLSMSSTNRQILTGSWRKDKTLQIWDHGSGKLIKDVPSDYNGSMVCSRDFQHAVKVITLIIYHPKFIKIPWSTDAICKRWLKPKLSSTLLSNI